MELIKLMEVRFDIDFSQLILGTRPFLQILLLQLIDHKTLLAACELWKYW